MDSFVPIQRRPSGGAVAAFLMAVFGSPYTLHAANAGAQPAPFLSFGAQPTELGAGEKARLSWASLNADSCTASGDWSGVQGATGRLDTAALTKPMTYTLSCTGPGGSIERRVFVNVLNATPEQVAAEAPPGDANTIAVPETVTTSEAAPAPDIAQPPEHPAGNAPVTASAPAPSTQRSTPAATPNLSGSLTLIASPSAVAYGGETTLTWSAKDASKCIASGAWAGTKSPAGREVLRGLNGESRFALTCMGPRGAASREVVVNVGAAAPVSVDLTTTADEIAPNAMTTLVWNASGAMACTASGAWFGPRETHGSESTTELTNSSTFAITCTGPGGSASDSVAVTVSANESAAAVSYTALQ